MLREKYHLEFVHLIHYVTHCTIYSERVTLELELVQYNLVHLLHNLLLKIWHVIYDSSICLEFSPRSVLMTRFAESMARHCNTKDGSSLDSSQRPGTGQQENWRTCQKHWLGSLSHRSLSLAKKNNARSLELGAGGEMPVTGFYQTTNTNGHSLKELDIEMSLSALCARYFVDKGNTTKLNTEN